MQDFRKLGVWQVANKLAVSIYRLTASFPKTEMYGLSSQMTRAAVSVGANIAEGCGRGTRADKIRFLQIAAGSACELENYLALTRDVGLIQQADYLRLDPEVNRVKRMLAGLTARMRAAEPPAKPTSSRRSASVVAEAVRVRPRDPGGER